MNKKIGSFYYRKVKLISKTVKKLTRKEQNVL